MKTIEKNKSAAEYHAETATPDNLTGPVSKSLLWKFAESPYKWRYGKHERASTPAMELGSLVHALAFTPEQAKQDYVVSEFENFRTKAAQEWRDAQVGKTVVTSDTWQTANEIADTVLNDEDMFLVGEKDYEVACYSKIGDTTIKGMIDIAPRHGNVLADLKTTNKIESVESITRKVLSLGYHWQAALYLDLWNAATGEERDEFRFMFVETESPHEIAWITLDTEFIKAGRAGYMNALAKWQSCVAIDVWPRQYEGITLIEKPAYL